MSDQHEDDLDLTAAEYVLGTLEPEAARAFQQRLVDDAGARASLSAWERRLARLGEDLAPVTPPATVWQRVAERTGIADEAPRDVRPAHVAPAANELPAAARRWRGLAMVASAAAVILAVALFVGAPGLSGGSDSASGAPAYASMIYDQPTGMSWLVTGHEHADNALSVEAMGNYDVPDGKTLQLWVESDDGQERRIGTLPHKAGHYAMPMPDPARQAMGPGSRFVVSMEDSDGVGNRPTGRIMWTSPVGRRTG